MMRTLAAAASIVIAGFVAGAAVGKPPGPPPRVSGVSSAPPPAWVESTRGARWLAYSSYCWKTTCADFVPPRQRSDLPRVAARVGERLGIHLGFRPTRVTLTLMNGPKDRVFTVVPLRNTSWRVMGLGTLLVDVASLGGSASYAARLTTR